MKMILSAMALAIAAPAMAQSTAPSNPHAGHPAPSAAATDSAANPHAGHMMTMDPKKMQEHCAQMKAAGHKMGGCDKMGAGSAPAADPHAGHDMGPKK